MKKPLKHYSLEQFIDQVIMAFSDSQKSDYGQLDQEVSDQLHQTFKLQMGISELQGQLFQLLDSRLGTFKTPFQARNYKKVILALQKSRILNTAEINVLFVKANRFLSKDSVKKEKTKIKNEVKAQYITEGAGKVYVHSSDDDSEGGNRQEESKKPPKKVAAKKGKVSEDSSEYEDVSSSDSEE